MTKSSFKEAAKLNNVWNKIVKWNGLNIATVMFHPLEWKIVADGIEWDTISDRQYNPIAEFHTQEELWQHIKKNSLNN